MTAKIQAVNGDEQTVSPSNLVFNGLLLRLTRADDWSRLLSMMLDLDMFEASS